MFAKYLFLSHLTAFIELFYFLEVFVLAEANTFLGLGQPQW